MKNVKVYLPVIIFALLLAAGWLAMYAQQLPIVDSPYAENGVIDLTVTDLNNTVVDLRWNWEFYPDALLSPDDFARGDLPPAAIRGELPDYEAIKTGTYHVKLKFPPGQTYALTGWTIDYGIRAYVNGDLAVVSGRVADNAPEAIPSVNYMTLPIVPRDGMAEIILQYSNFHHNEGGSLTFMYVATSQLIERYKIVTTLPMYILSGGLLLLFAYHLLEFCLRRKPETLFFALLCLLFALRDQRFYFSLLIPWDYNWPLHYSLMFVRFVLVVPLCWLMMNSLYRGLLNKWVSIVFLAGCGALCALAVMAPATEIIKYSAYFETAVIPFIVYFVLRIIWRHIKERGGSADSLIITFGLFVLLITFLRESALHRILPSVTRGGVTPAGMLVFVFCMMTALSIRANRDAAQLTETRRLAEELERMERVRSEFLSNMSHEIKTPLTVMSGYAQLTSWQLEDSATNDETMRNLKTISSEAQRLADMVTKLLALSFGDEAPAKKTKIEADALLADAAAVCRPILQKKDNALLIDCAECPPALGNYEMLLQVLINLAINAGKHTEQGVVTFSAKEDEADDGLVIFRVADTGDGISPEDAQRVFEKGFSRDEGNGLGLSISREVVEAGGGTIEIERTGGDGTTISFTVPRWREE